MPHLTATKMKRDTLTLEGPRGTHTHEVGPERTQGGARVVRAAWGEHATTVRAECVRALRQPERLLRDPRLLAPRVEELTGVTLSQGDARVELVRRGPARWGTTRADGELPAAPGVIRYAWRLEALEEVAGRAPPQEALALTANHSAREDTLWLWEDTGGGWRARSGHTGATVRVGGDAAGAVADLIRLMEQASAGALAPAHAVDPEHGAGGR